MIYTRVHIGLCIDRQSGSHAALDGDSLHRLDLTGAPKLPSISVLWTAAKTRTALETASTWRGWRASLVVKARDYLPLWHLQQGYWWPKFLWQSEPIAETLFKADAGSHPIAAAQQELHTYITKVKQETLERRTVLLACFAKKGLKVPEANLGSNVE